MPHGDYKKEFDESVRHLEAVRAKLLEAASPSEVSQIENEVRKSLLAVIHYSNFLSFWMQDAANQRRKELRDATLAGFASAAPALTVEDEPAKKSKRTRKTGKTKSKKEEK